MVADIAHVVWAVNLGCLGLHLWPYRATIPSTPTSSGSTSTPNPGSRSTRSARPPALPELSRELGIVAYAKTTGNRGIHVYVRLEPRWDSFEVRAAAVALARELERRLPIS